MSSQNTWGVAIVSLFVVVGVFSFILLKPKKPINGGGGNNPPAPPPSPPPLVPLGPSTPPNTFITPFCAVQISDVIDATTTIGGDPFLVVWDSAKSAGWSLGNGNYLVNALVWGDDLKPGAVITLEAKAGTSEVILSETMVLQNAGQIWYILLSGVMILSKFNNLGSVNFYVNGAANGQLLGGSVQIAQLSNSGVQIGPNPTIPLTPVAPKVNLLSPFCQTQISDIIAETSTISSNQFLVVWNSAKSGGWKLANGNYLVNAMVWGDDLQPGAIIYLSLWAGSFSVETSNSVAIPNKGETWSIQFSTLLTLNNTNNFGNFNIFIQEAINGQLLGGSVQITQLSNSGVQIGPNPTIPLTPFVPKTNLLSPFCAVQISDVITGTSDISGAQFLVVWNSAKSGGWKLANGNYLVNALVWGDDLKPGAVITLEANAGASQVMLSETMVLQNAGQTWSIVLSGIMILSNNNNAGNVNFYVNGAANGQLLGGSVQIAQLSNSGVQIGPNPTKPILPIIPKTNLLSPFCEAQISDTITNITTITGDLFFLPWNFAKSAGWALPNGNYLVNCLVWGNNFEPGALIYLSLFTGVFPVTRSDSILIQNATGTHSVTLSTVVTLTKGNNYGTVNFALIGATNGQLLGGSVQITQLSNSGIQIGPNPTTPLTPVVPKVNLLSPFCQIQISDTITNITTISSNPFLVVWNLAKSTGWKLANGNYLVNALVWGDGLGLGAIITLEAKAGASEVIFSEPMGIPGDGETWSIALSGIMILSNNNAGNLNFYVNGAANGRLLGGSVQIAQLSNSGVQIGPNPTKPILPIIPKTNPFSPFCEAQISDTITNITTITGDLFFLPWNFAKSAGWALPNGNYLVNCFVWGNSFQPGALIYLSLFTGLFPVARSDSVLIQNATGTHSVTLSTVVTLTKENNYGRVKFALISATNGQILGGSVQITQLSNSGVQLSS